VLPRLRRRFPKLKLYLREDLTARLLEMLDRGDLDVALIALPYETPNIETQVLFEDPFVLMVRKDDALARHGQVRSSDLAREPLLLLAEGHCMRGHALSACRQPRSAETQALEATSLLTLVQMVENGLGATLLPQFGNRRRHPARYQARHEAARRQRGEARSRPRVAQGHATRGRVQVAWRSDRGDGA
jgi:LysR family transcriptional regulator, hydrogen peroxide-inducible genes activator